MTSPPLQALIATPSVSLAMLATGLNPDGTVAGTGSKDPVGGKLLVANMRPGVPLDIGAYSAAAALLGPSLPAAVGVTTYMTGFEITGCGATAATSVVASIAGTLTAFLYYVIAVPAGAAVGITPIIVEFTTPVPASAPNTAISLAVPSFGAGNVQVAANIHGFQL